MFLAALTFAFLYTANQIVAFAYAMALAALAILAGSIAGSKGRLNRKDILYGMYAAIAILPSLRFWDPYGFTFYLRVVLYPWAISIMFQNIRLSWTRLHALSAVVLGVVFVTVGQMLFQEAPGQFDISVQRLLTLDRTEGFYYRGDERTGPNAASAMCVAGIALSLSLLKFRRIRLPHASALLGLLSVFLMVSGGRIAAASGVGLVLLYAATTLSATRRERGKELLSTVAIVTLLAVGSLFMYRVLASTQGDTFLSRVAGLANPMEDSSLLVRFQEWGRAFEMITAEPFGSGFNAYYGIYGRTPHNELLGQWIGGGWAGVLLYVALFSYLIARSGLRLARGVSPDESGFTHYLAFSLLSVTMLMMITEHISRGGMGTYYPLLWVSVGLTFAGWSRQDSASTVILDASRSSEPQDRPAAT